MNAEPAPLEGFRSVDRSDCRLIAAREQFQAVTDAGLDRPAGWRDRLAGRKGRAGRGATASLDLGNGTTVFLKQLRRGGLAGHLWRERFPGTARLIENLTTPNEVARRGIPTPAPVALLLLSGPPGLYRGYLATERIDGAHDLGEYLTGAAPGTGEELGLALDLVRRFHDVGVEHRDLNLGNLLIAAVLGERRAMVIDLDRARLHPGPLAFRLRQRALRRLERSHLRRVGELGARRREWFERYSGDDGELLDRLKNGESAGRLWLRLRR